MKHAAGIISIVALTVALLAGCGKKGALIAPEALVPAAVQELRVQQQGADFRITWQAPTREQGGRPLRDLAGFRLQRRDISPDGNDCAACPDSWQLLTTVDLDLSGEVRKSGATFIYLDRGLPPESSSQYKLLALSRSGGSSAAAMSPLKKMQPVVPAPAIKAELQPSSIRIAFTFTPPAGAKLLGYNIYRRLTAAEPLLLPLNSAPLPQAVWEDQQLQFGQSYRYSATALVELGGESVESLPSPEVELVFSLQELR